MMRCTRIGGCKSMAANKECLFEGKCPFQSGDSSGGPWTPLAEQVGGDHYKSMAIQPIEFIVKNGIPYREANVIKYVCRHRAKNGRQDIEKAIHYLQMILEDYPS